MMRRAKDQPAQRPLRVGEALRHALAQLLERGELRDPALQAVTVTVTEVRVSPDLKNATVFIMPLGGVRAEEVVAALRRGAPYLRRAMAQAVALRHAPALAFELDTSFDYASRIDALLHRPEVERDLAPGPAESEGSGESEGKNGT